MLEYLEADPNLIYDEVSEVGLQSQPLKCPEALVPSLILLSVGSLRKIRKTRFRPNFAYFA